MTKPRWWKAHRDAFMSGAGAFLVTVVLFGAVHL